MNKRKLQEVINTLNDEAKRNELEARNGFLKKWGMTEVKNKKGNK